MLNEPLYGHVRRQVRAYLEPEVSSGPLQYGPQDLDLLGPCRHARFKFTNIIVGGGVIVFIHNAHG